MLGPAVPRATAWSSSGASQNGCESRGHGSYDFGMPPSNACPSASREVGGASFLESFWLLSGWFLKSWHLRLHRHKPYDYHPTALSMFCPCTSTGFSVDRPPQQTVEWRCHTIEQGMQVTRLIQLCGGKKSLVRCQIQHRFMACRLITTPVSLERFEKWSDAWTT